MRYFRKVQYQALAALSNIAGDSRGWRRLRHGVKPWSGRSASPYARHRSERGSAMNSIAKRSTHSRPRNYTAGRQQIARLDQAAVTADQNLERTERLCLCSIRRIDIVVGDRPAIFTRCEATSLQIPFQLSVQPIIIDVALQHLQSHQFG